MDIIDVQYFQLISNALSSDKATRETSEKNIFQLALSEPEKFLFNLSSILADEANPTPARQMSAAIMKNFITIAEKSRDIWVNMESKAKNQVKNLILSTLASQDKNVRKAAGLVIAGICKVDLPIAEKWPDLISSLCTNSYNENMNIRHAALESLGYMCEELTNKSIDSVSVDSILSALIRNITEKEINNEILFTALNAFLHCLPLAEKNFSKQNEIEIIMNALFDVCSLNTEKDLILEKISQIFIDICEIYYDHISPFITKIAEFTFWIVSFIIFIFKFSYFFTLKNSNMFSLIAYTISNSYIVTNFIN